MQAAKFRGGAFDAASFAGVHLPATWHCHAGHTFTATPYTVMGAGHWCPKCAPRPWDFDAQAKHNPFYAQVWYDTHGRDENVRYDVDAAGKAVMEHTEEV